MSLNEQRAVEIAEAVREIERELARRLAPVERIAIESVLERFAERWPQERERGRFW